MVVTQSVGSKTHFRSPESNEGSENDGRAKFHQCGTDETWMLGNEQPELSLGNVAVVVGVHIGERLLFMVKRLCPSVMLHVPCS